MKYAIVVSEFNKSISDQMLKECIRGFKEQDIEPLVFWVPGSVEIPLAAQLIIDKESPAAVVALGCVIKGETEHFEAVCRMCSYGINEVMLKTNTPIVFEVLMTDKYQKAEDRIDKGYHAAFVATKMAKLLKSIS